MRDFLEFVGVIVAVILLIDFICLLLWIMSGQTPPDFFFFGAISKHIISLFI